MAKKIIIEFDYLTDKAGFLSRSISPDMHLMTAIQTLEELVRALNAKAAYKIVAEELEMNDEERKKWLLTLTFADIKDFGPPI
jgi:hypothetical protein